MTRSSLTTSVLAAIVVVASPAWAQDEVLPGDAARGRQVLESKGCLGCHSFDGRGGQRASDLALRSMRLYTPDLLASVMWNHGPTMWNQILENGGTIPRFTTAGGSRPVRLLLLDPLFH